VEIQDMPGPARLASASIAITPQSVKLDRATVSMLDARAIASGTLDYGRRLHLQGTVSEASVGESFLAWIWKTADLPPPLALRTPIRVAVQSADWAPKQALQLEASAEFDAGPRLAVALALAPDAIEVRRAAVKDAASDAVMSVRIHGKALQGAFSGSLRAASIESMLKSAKLPSGTVAGDLKLTYDREHPRRSSAEGRLTVEALDVAGLLGRPAKIERVDLTADAETVRIREAAIDVAGQGIKLQGTIRRGASGPVVDAQVDSPGIV